MLTRRRGWPRGIKWALGVLVAVLLTLAVGWLLFVPIADWLATHDLGQVTGPLQLQRARDAARGRLLTYGAGLFAAGALIFTARNFTLSREGQVTDRYIAFLFSQLVMTPDGVMKGNRADSIAAVTVAMFCMQGSLRPRPPEVPCAKRGGFAQRC